MKVIHFKRLLNVAKALRESKKPKAFTMEHFIHYRTNEYPDGSGKFPCGTPACALGHYAARRDLQRAFAIDDELFFNQPIDQGEEHFGISSKEWYVLFSEIGCGGAKTAKQAARYIERFVARKRKEAKR